MAIVGQPSKIEQFTGELVWGAIIALPLALSGSLAIYSGAVVAIASFKMLVGSCVGGACEIPQNQQDNKKPCWIPPK